MTDNLHTIFSGSGCPTHNQLKAYLDDRLPRDEKHQIESHLADCEMCSDEIEGLSLLSDPYRLPAIVEELEHRIAAGNVRIFHLNTKMIMAAAAVIILLTGAIFIFRYIIHNQQEPMLTEQQIAPDTQVEMVIPLPQEQEIISPLSEKKEMIRETSPVSTGKHAVEAAKTTDVPVVSSPTLTPAGTIPEIQEHVTVIENKAVESLTQVVSG
ncbi:MAG: zf-HC2 domain-containing protein, partial [Bacteroidia bacterium]|nr:zf-HC2 domain-containing protein [Bacteroidia bacterium]